MVRISLSYLMIAFSNQFCCSAQVEVSDDGPAVTDIPITFTAVVVGDVALDVNQFVYQFDDSSVSPSPVREINAGRTVNLTVTYGSKTSPGEYYMKVQVFAYIWGVKAWEVATQRHKFRISCETLSVFQVYLIQFDSLQMNSAVASIYHNPKRH